MMTTTERLTIATENDRFRRQLGIGAAPGRTMLTRGLAALPPGDLEGVLRSVRAFDAFTPSNDPWHEHDCARVDTPAGPVLFKFDYFADDNLDRGAENGLRCYRVLTLMLAEEY